MIITCKKCKKNKFHQVRSERLCDSCNGYDAEYRRLKYRREKRKREERLRKLKD